VRYGATCRYFAHTVLNADVFPLDEVCLSDSAKFDLVGVFHSLDHVTFPLEVVRKLTAVANHVLLVTHRAEKAGKQHLYALGDEFPAWLTAMIPTLSIEELSGEVDDGHGTYNYLLLTRKVGDT
jgi:hypothetical protein